MGENKRIRISASEFSRILSMGRAQVSRGGAHFDRNFTNGNRIQVKNAIVSGAVHASSISRSNTEIEIVDVLFEHIVQFQYGSYQTLSFSGCQFQALIRFTEAEFSERLIFKDSTFDNNLELHSCKCIIIYLGNVQCQTTAIFKSSYTRLIIEDSKLYSLDHLETTIKTSLIIHQTRIDMISCSLSVIEQISLSSCAVNIMGLHLSRFGRFDMSLSDVKEDMGFETCTVSEKLYIETSTIKELRLGIKYFKNASFESNTIRSLKIDTEIPKDSILVLDDCIIESFEFNSMKNSGSLRLLHIVSPESSSLSILNSDLGMTDFIRCNFDNAVFHFTNSKIAESFLAETNFPKRVCSDKQLNHHQAQLAFGQLQTAYQRQGDSVRASEYQAREIEAHYKTISWTTHFPTKLNLLLNKISNNYGRNWAQGIAFSFLIGLLVFYCLILSSEEFYLAWNFSHVSDLTDSFLKFMNPLRHFETENLFADKSPRVTPNPWSYIWDFAGRIFVAYGYYQTIQAFRRFGKK